MLRSFFKSSYGIIAAGGDMHTMIQDFRKGERIIDFYMIKSLNIRTSKNNKQYLDLFLSDASGEIDAKKWNLDEGEAEIYEQGDLVKVELDVTLFNERLQAKIIQMRPVEQRDEVSYNDIILSAPLDPKVMLENILQEVDGMENEDLKRMSRKLIEKNKEKLLYYPAAKVNHHAMRSGLLYHYTRMIEVAKKLCEVYPARYDLLLSGILFHDMQKLREMNSNKLGIVSEYTIEGELIGHISLGVVEVRELAKELNVSEEVTLLLQHMVLSHHDRPEYGSPKPPMFLEAELLHLIDEMDARVYDYEKAMRHTEAGNLSDRIFSLGNRRVYKAHLHEELSSK